MFSTNSLPFDWGLTKNMKIKRNHTATCYHENNQKLCSLKSSADFWKNFFNKSRQEVLDLIELHVYEMFFLAWLIWTQATSLHKLLLYLLPGYFSKTACYLLLGFWMVICFVLFLWQGLYRKPWLSWNSLCRPDWLETHRDLPVSTSWVPEPCNLQWSWLFPAAGLFLGETDPGV